MNNGILSTPNFSVATDLVGIKPLLGVPQTIPTPYPRTIDAIIGNSNGEGKDFVMVVDTSKGGSTTISITLNISPNGGLIELVDWGDGTNGALIPSSIGTIAFPKAGSFETRFVGGGSPVISHTYAKHGIYIVIIRGTIGLMGYVANNIPHAGAATTAILSYGKLNIATLNHSSLINLTYIPPYLEKGIPNPGAGVYPNLTSCFAGMNFKIDNNVTYWDTSNVRDMRFAFLNCKNIVVNGNWNWDTSATNNSTQMFAGAILNNINFSGWKFVTANNMFTSTLINDCSFINWSGSNATSMFQSATLNNCTLSGWRLTSVANLMFNGTAGNNLFVPSWDLRGVTNCSQMFFNSNGTKSGLDNWNVSGVTSMNRMFNGGSDFMTADLSNWDISKVTDFTLFMIRNGATTTPNAAIRIDNWKIPSGAILTGMFGDAAANKWVSLSGWSFGGNSAAGMFQAYNYTAVANTFNNDLTTWDTSGINNTASMFQNCGHFRGTGINGDLRVWNTSNITNMSNMFLSCSNLITSVSGWDTSKVTNMSGMFRNTFSNIAGGVRFGWYGDGLEYWNTSNVTNMSRMFESNYTMDVNFSGWDTGKVTDMSSMFRTGGLGVETFFTGKGLNNWNVTGVITVNAMFQGFFNKTDLNVNLSGWNLCNCTDMTNFMFNCNIGSGNYDILLNSWERSSTGNPIKPWATGINVHFGKVKYTAASSGARQRLINYGWTITDGGFQA